VKPFALSVPMDALAPLQAVGDFLVSLDELVDERRRVQALRRRADAEIFPLFRRPYAPVRTDHAYLEAMAAVRRAFDLDRLFARRRATRLVVIPARRPERLQEVAESAARYVSVAYAGNGSTAQTEVERYAASADVVVVDGGGTAVARRARGVLVVIDSDVDDSLREAADVVVDDRDADVTLRSIVEEPWRWRLSARPAPATEELQALLARWRREHGISRGRAWQLGQALWQFTPSPLRDVIRRIRRGDR
jgi:hypothetical protein